MKGFVGAILILVVALHNGHVSALGQNSDILRAPGFTNENVQNALDDLIMEILNSFRDRMSTGFPELGIPPLDPFTLGSIPLDIQETLLKVKGDLSDIHADSLSTFEVTNVKSNLILLTLEMEMELPAFSINGDYDIDGLAALIFPIYGKGPFSITVSGVKLVGGAKLAVIFGGFKVKDLQYNLTLSDINVKFEGLLGGGDLGEVINDIITSLGVKIFNMVEPLIHDTMIDAMTALLNYALGPKDGAPLGLELMDAMIQNNNQLAVRTPIIDVDMLRADAGAYIDQVLANLRHQMIMTGLDKIDLPDNTLEFSQVVLGVRWHGTASMFSGVLRGLETIHRSGPANLVLEPNGDIVFDAELAVNDARLFSSMLVKFMGLGPTATVTGTLKSVSVGIKCRVAAGLSNVTLEVLNIKNLGYLSIDVSGLGIIFNFLTEIVSEFFGNLIKGIVVNIIEVPIKALLNSIISTTMFTSTSPALVANVVNNIALF